MGFIIQYRRLFINPMMTVNSNLLQIGAGICIDEEPTSNSISITVSFINIHIGLTLGILKQGAKDGTSSEEKES